MHSVKQDQALFTDIAAWFRIRHAQSRFCPLDGAHLLHVTDVRLSSLDRAAYMPEKHSFANALSPCSITLENRIGPRGAAIVRHFLVMPLH